MKYIGLEKLRNTYPDGVEDSTGTVHNVEDSYKTDGTTVTYTGIYPNLNFIEFSTVSINDIKFDSIHTQEKLTFRFLVKMKDGEQTTYWTSEEFFQDLQKGLDEPQPYFNRNNITVAEIDASILKNYWLTPKFDIPQKFAEVTVTDSINTTEDILQHINWIISGDEELRPIQTFGEWELYTTESLGFEWLDTMEELENND